MAVVRGDKEGNGFGGVRSPVARGAGQVAVELSDVDRRMIRILQSDGRRPFADMAAELAVDARTVRRRVERLREDGIIEITTVADPELLGYGASAMVGITVDGAVSPSTLATRLGALTQVDYVVVSTGRFQLLIEVLCATTEELIETLEDRIRPMAGIIGCESFPYLRLYYQQPQWDAAHQRRATGAVAAEVVTLDDVDRRIVLELNADGRASFRSMAERLDVSEGLVRQRANRLIDSGAIRVMALTNPLSLGFQVLAWLSILAAPGVQLEQLADRLAGCGAIAYLALCTGRCDAFAEAVCTDRDDLLRLLDEEIRPMPEVARVEVSICADLRYRRLRPRFSAST
jgi:Lrp/AsnC family transcriptional regulator for asnA, asnC and gidA